MAATQPWLDEHGMVHSNGIPVLPLASAPGQAWLATVRGGLTVRLGPRQFTIRPETGGDGLSWYALKRCQGKLHKIQLGLQSAITMERLREVAKELETRCGSLAQATIFDLQTAQATVDQARSQLEQQGRLGKQLSQHLLEIAEQALSLLAAAEQRPAPELVDEEPAEPVETAPVVVEPAAPWPPPPAAQPTSIKLAGATEEDVRRQMDEQQAQYGHRLVMGTPRPGPHGGWLVYGMLRVEAPTAEAEPAPAISVEAPPPPAPSTTLTVGEPRVEPSPGEPLSPGLEQEIQRVLQVRQALQRALDKQHDMELLNPKRATTIVELLREALVLRRRVLLLEMILEQLPELVRQDEAEQEEALLMFQVLAAQQPALQKLHDQVEDQAELVADNLAESRKLIGRLRSRFLNVAWKVHEVLGTGRLQRLWSDMEAYGLDPAQWVQLQEPTGGV